ncbi:hypothetical protein P8452_75292 [Trifolium repens]|nr:hypothetical protein P8452_75292 [Trifolium repens]
MRCSFTPMKIENEGHGKTDPPVSHAGPPSTTAEFTVIKQRAQIVASRLLSGATPSDNGVRSPPLRFYSLFLKVVLMESIMQLSCVSFSVSNFLVLVIFILYFKHWMHDVRIGNNPLLTIRWFSKCLHYNKGGNLNLRCF